MGLERKSIVRFPNKGALTGDETMKTARTKQLNEQKKVKKRKAKKGKKKR